MSFNGVPLWPSGASCLQKVLEHCNTVLKYDQPHAQAA